MEISTLFGFFGLITNTIWPLCKKRKHILLGQIIACTFMMLHFILLNADTGAAIMFVAGIQASLAIPLENNTKFKNIYILSMLLTPVIIWYTWHGLPSLFSAAALLLFCYGNLQVNIIKMRVFLILCILAWVGHNILISSIPGLISNILAISTSMYALYNLLTPTSALATHEDTTI